MNDLAREALGRVISNYGPSICQIPRSCELFVRQECAAYPDEARVLVEALRQGVPNELMSYRPGDRPWQTLSGELRHQLNQKAGLNEAEGNWAVDTWAHVLGRHPEAWSVAPEVTSATPERTVSRTTLATAMTFIVTAGGAAGGALGAVLMPAAVLLTQAAAEVPFMSKPVRSGASMDVWIAVILVLLVIAAVGAVGGAIGGALGWIYGKGDQKPWTGFGAAFGAAFTGAALSGYFCGFFGWFLGALLGALSASTTVARRGGFER